MQDSRQTSARTTKTASESDHTTEKRPHASFGFSKERETASSEKTASVIRELNNVINQVPASIALMLTARLVRHITSTEDSKPMRKIGKQIGKTIRRAADDVWRLEDELCQELLRQGFSVVEEDGTMRAELRRRYNEEYANEPEDIATSIALYMIDIIGTHHNVFFRPEDHFIDELSESITEMIKDGWKPSADEMRNNWERYRREIIKFRGGDQVIETLETISEGRRVQRFDQEQVALH